MRRPRAGLAPCVRDALGLPSAPTKWGRLHWLDAGQSPREPVGSDPARIDNSICPRPGSTVPGSEIAAMMERRKARVSPLARRRAPVSSRGGIGNRDVALRGAPSPSINDRGMKKLRRPRAVKNRGGDACPKTGGLFDNLSDDKSQARLSLHLTLRAAQSAASRRTRWPRHRARLMVRDGPPSL